MKLLVQTNGDYALYDLNGRQVIAAHRPTVVTRTPFVDVNRGGKLTVLEELADDASDDTLAEAKDAAEIKAAVDALPRARKPEPKVEPKVETKPAPKPTGKAKK